MLFIKYFQNNFYLQNKILKQFFYVYDNMIFELKKEIDYNSYDVYLFTVKHCIVAL